LEDYNLTIEASPTVQTFKYDNLRYATNKWKDKIYGMCHYQVMNPTYYYKSGNVKIKFTEIEKGVKLYINSGSDVRNMTNSLINNNGTVSVGDQFTIDQSLNYIVTVIPDKNSYNTSYAFEYSTDGSETYEWYELYYYQWFLKPKYGY